MSMSAVMLGRYKVFTPILNYEMKTKQPEPLDHAKIELRPDGWERFRAAVHAAAKSGPKHRQPKDGRKERPASKGRVHKGKSRT
jgi:hypothetical protein